MDWASILEQRRACKTQMRCCAEIYRHCSFAWYILHNAAVLIDRRGTSSSAKCRKVNSCSVGDGWAYCGIYNELILLGAVPVRGSWHSLETTTKNFLRAGIKSTAGSATTRRSRLLQYPFPNDFSFPSATSSYTVTTQLSSDYIASPRDGSAIDLT